MKFGTFLSGAGKALKFVYDHPQVLEVAAAATGHPGFAADIATVVAAKKGVASVAPAPVVVPVSPDAPAPTPAPPVEPSGLVPEVDIVTKWRGTIDHMAMDILGYRMNEDEYYSNAKLLEAGDVEGVRKNIEKKRS